MIFNLLQFTFLLNSITISVNYLQYLFFNFFFSQKMNLMSNNNQAQQNPITERKWKEKYNTNRQNTQFQKSARKNTFALLQQEHNKKQNNKNKKGKNTARTLKKIATKIESFNYILITGIEILHFKGLKSNP